MAAAKAGFEESLCEALSGINLETGPGFPPS